MGKSEKTQGQVIHQRPADAPFDVRESRAMISLGPLSPKKYCTYSCPFCYVQADFLSYASLGITDIVDWLSRQDGSAYDVIYVSGDTDSFAPPRTRLGLELLEALTDLNKDILFTTRAVFDEDALLQLETIATSMKVHGLLLFGCTSVAQLTVPHLEPKPISPPERRIQQLFEFKARGLVSVLAMRPFLPNVPISDYLKILDLARDGIDVALGAAWYADMHGILERGVFQGEAPIDVEYEVSHMPFDSNTSTWKLFEALEAETAVRRQAIELGIPFFMRSRPAIEWARARPM